MSSNRRPKRNGAHKRNSERLRFWQSRDGQSVMAFINQRREDGSTSNIRLKYAEKTRVTRRARTDPSQRRYDARPFVRWPPCTATRVQRTLAESRQDICLAASTKRNLHLPAVSYANPTTNRRNNTACPRHSPVVPLLIRPCSYNAILRPSTVVG